MLRIRAVLTTSALVQTGLACLRLSADTNSTAGILKTHERKTKNTIKGKSPRVMPCFVGFLIVMMEIRASFVEHDCV